MTEKTENIYTRLIAAQTDFKNIRQGNTASAFGSGRGYAYADISDVLEVVRPILSSHGLAVIQKTTTESERVGIETVLYSPEGESISSGLFYVSTAGLTQKGAQAYGSALTYARRYSLVSFLGLAYGDKDDDAVEASKDAYKKPAGKKPAAKPEAKDFTSLEVKAREFETATKDEYAAFFKSLSNEDRLHLKETGIHDQIKAKFEK
jgi:hypothetical protein